MPTTAPRSPHTTSMSANPEPGPVPRSGPNTIANPPPPRIAGSNTPSAKGPAIAIAAGAVIWAISRRAANTFPWTSGATFACQIAWFDPFMKGRMKEEQNAAMAQTVISRPTPIKNAPRTPEIAIPPRTPWTRRFGPPHALSASPPATPPTAAAELTAPRMNAFLPVRDRSRARRGVRGPLDRLERPGDRPHDVPVPDLEEAGEIEEQEDNRPDARREVAEHHRELPVPPVHEGPRDG